MVLLQINISRHSLLACVVVEAEPSLAERFVGKLVRVDWLQVVYVTLNPLLSALLYVFSFEVIDRHLDLILVRYCATHVVDVSIVQQSDCRGSFRWLLRVFLHPAHHWVTLWLSELSFRLVPEFQSLNETSNDFSALTHAFNTSFHIYNGS